MNISGDPTLTVTTPGLNIAPIDFNPPAGTPFNVLSDPDNNFKMDVNLHVINDTGSKAIAETTMTVNGHQVKFANDGGLLVDGTRYGSLQNGVAPIDLGNGNSVRTALMDDGNGTKALRFVVDTPEYQITAAKRQPNGTLPYYDVNVAEKTAGAADNATGNAINNQTFSVADLLKREPT